MGSTTPGVCAEPVQRIDPEIKQSAGPWILQDEQAAVAELLGQDIARPGAVLPGHRGRPPVGIERLPVVPAGAGGSEQFLVEGRYLLGLPIPRRVELVRRHQGAGQVAAEVAQDPRQRGGAAAVHARDDDGHLPHVSVHAGIQSVTWPARPCGNWLSRSRSASPRSAPRRARWCRWSTRAAPAVHTHRPRR